MEFRNFLLSALSAEDAAALAPALKEVTVTRGQTLFEAGDPVENVFFPGSACISIVTTMRDGKMFETSTIGRESAIALLDAATDRPAQSRMFAQIGGSAMTLPAALYRARMRESATLLDLTLMHARANAQQAEMGVACNLAHSAQGRLARWILMTQDRTGSDTFALTQEYLAVMIGVQRTTVSQMAAGLKRAKVIDYARGSLSVCDRPALIQHACECYADAEQQFAALRAGAA